MSTDVKKGQLLVVKAPPYYQKTYIYEVLSAGDKQIRASLYHSPKVRKVWTVEEFHLLIEMEVIKFAEPSEIPTAPPAVAQEADSEQSDLM